MKKQNSPTIKEVAAAAGVSTATVSRVINGLGAGYGAEVKSKVLKAIEKLGYDPNTVARTMITGSSQSLGVLIPDVSSSFSSLFLRGVEMVASQQGYNVFITHTEANGHKTLDYLKALYEKRVDGIIFLSEVFQPEFQEFVNSRKIPIVLACTQADPSTYPAVKVDDFEASRDGVLELIRLGHRKIGMISGTADDPVAGSPRIAGYKKALEDMDIPFQADYIVDAKGFKFFDIPAVKPQIDYLVDSGVTAFFCASDELAAGLLKHLTERGVSVPQSVSILGYDDLPISLMVSPSLSTIVQPIEEMGAQAVRILIKIEQGLKIEPLLKIYDHKIVLRGSTRALHIKK